MSFDEEYWKDTLLCDYENIIAKAESITIEELNNNKKYSQRVLSTYLNDFDLREILLKRLLKNEDKLKEFLLIEEFTNGTLQNIVGKIMELYLPESQLHELTKKGNKKSKEYTKYDKFAGIIRLYQKDPDLLIKIQLLEKINRKSQPTFIINIENIDKLKKRLDSTENIEKDLKFFDDKVSDNKKSKYIGWFDIEDDVYIYFIREYKRSMALTLEAPRFDTVCEWIIFRIPIESNQVRVSYESNIDIKRFIPTMISGWQKGSVSSEEEVVKEFEALNTRENVKKFFETILTDKSFPLVEIRFEPAPFKEAPVLALSDKKNKSIKSTIKWFKENNKDLFKDITTIAECKVYFNKHRLKIKFKQIDDGIAIHYLDSNIQIDLRKEFEKSMLEKFNLRIIPGI